VKDASRAVVFAREVESYRRITAMCDARLAHDFIGHRESV